MKKRPKKNFAPAAFPNKPQLGEYFADYDEESALYCVFHTDKKTGFAYSSWACMEDAKKDAIRRNDEHARKRELDYLET